MNQTTVIFIIFIVMIFAMVFLLGYMQLSPGSGLAMMSLMDGGGYTTKTQYGILLTVCIFIGLLGLMYHNERRTRSKV